MDISSYRNGKSGKLQQKPKKKKHKKSAVNACAVAQGRNEAENEAYLEATFTTRLSHWYSSMRICIF